MSREKVCISILMVLILIVLSGASVWAAPNRQDVTGEVQNIQIDPWVDPDTGDTITTVLVTLEDDLGETQTVRVSVGTAKDQGLLQVDADGDLVLDPDSGDPIPIDPNTIEEPVNIPDGEVIEVIDEDEEEEEGEEPTEHPVASALFEFFVEDYLPEFFADTLELDYETIMGYHEEDGMGFGVIAQACWMASMLYDDTKDNNITPNDILEAKRAHDFDSITLSEDGEPIITLPNGEVPTNWGQFRKAVLGSEKGQKNLGAIMSGRAKPPGETDSDNEDEDENENQNELGATSTEGKVKGQKDKAGGKPDTPPGQMKNKSGEPDTPPGKVKNKDKGKGGGKKK